MYLIKRKKELNPTVMLMDIQAPEVAAKARAGQFIILRVDDEGSVYRLPLRIMTQRRERLPLYFR